MSAELVVSQALPVMSVPEAVQRRTLIVEFTRQCMVEGVDFGVIPGAREQTLLKPGAEKLCTLFGLAPHFTILTQVEDWTGASSDGEPLFYYLYRCSLYRGGALIAEGDGSCNSREKKYRYRQAQRLCPRCEQPAIIKGRAEYGGGWICHRNKGGCGAKFSDGDPQIEEQEVGQILNADIYDLVNTIQKMAQKRALTAATLLAVNASEFFTQDLEDIETPWKPGSAAPGSAAVGEVRKEALAEKLSPQAEQTSRGGMEDRKSVRHGKGRQEQVLSDLAARQKAIGYAGPVKPLVVAVLGTTPEPFRLSHYIEALARPEAEWRLAAERLAGSAGGEAVEVPELENVPQTREDDSLSVVSTAAPL
jgi:hypothetical protein